MRLFLVEHLVLTSSGGGESELGASGRDSYYQNACKLRFIMLLETKKLRGRVRDRDRKIFQSPVHSSISSKGLGSAKLQPGSQSIFQFIHMDEEAQAAGSSFLAISSVLAEGWIGIGVARGASNSHTGHWCQAVA